MTWSLLTTVNVPCLKISWDLLYYMMTCSTSATSIGCLKLVFITFYYTYFDGFSTLALDMFPLFTQGYFYSDTTSLTIRTATLSLLSPSPKAAKLSSKGQRSSTCPKTCTWPLALTLIILQPQTPTPGLSHPPICTDEPIWKFVWFHSLDLKVRPKAPGWLLVC